MTVRALAVPAVALCMALAAPAASQGFGVKVFEAGTCKTNVPECTYSSPHGQFFTQAAGHPALGVTSVELNHHESLLDEAPEGALKRMRVDVPPGLAANPEALPQCTEADFSADKCPADTQVGTTEVTAWLAAARTTVSGEVYNLAPSTERHVPLLFGIHIEVPLVANEHLYLVGHVEWNGDYHEYFEINNISSSIPVIKSKLLFNGNAGNGNFLTLPSVCSSSTTSNVELESYEGAIARSETHTPVGVDGCGEVPFQPSVTVSPETAHSDLPDGALVDVHVPQQAGAGEINTADVRDVHFQMPEGMTLNPAAARGLGVCTEAQYLAAACPAASEVGSVTIETDLPAGSLKGAMYLGSPAGATITEPPFTLYLVAQTVYGVTVRLHGQVAPNAATGRLETTFLGNPQLPFSDILFKLKGGPRAPVANPLGCGTRYAETLFTPWTGLAAWLSKTPFTTDNVAGGACPNPLPFNLGQSAQTSSHTAGAATSYTLAMERKEGQQYLGKLSTTLPAGLVGLVPAVTQCGEPLAAAGNCPAASQIGTATVTVGSGSEPYAFSGPVYFTGPYGGAPFGLSIPVEAAAGPFDLGRVVTRTGISVDPYTARVIATTALPTIVRGVPLRLRTLSVAVNRSGFLLNPTNCGPLTQDSALTSTTLGTSLVSSPFQVGGCSSLQFVPSVAAGSNKLTASRANGIGLEVSVSLPAHDSNARSVVTTLPMQLPSRLTTLQKACLAATFAANPRSCSPESLVGTATVHTPVLPVPLTGPAYLVAKGGASFPDLDLVLEGDGVRVIINSNTAIHNGITTSTFGALPDVPFSSFALTLPPSPHSALASYGNLCAKPLLLPMVMTAQSGAQVHLSPRITVTGCGVRIVKRRRKGRFILLTLQTFAPGSVTVSGHGIGHAKRHVRKASTFTIKLRIARRPLRALHKRHHRVRLTISVAFKPDSHGEASVHASTAMLFKH